MGPFRNGMIVFLETQTLAEWPLETTAWQKYWFLGLSSTKRLPTNACSLQCCSSFEFFPRCFMVTVVIGPCRWSWSLFKGGWKCTCFPLIVNKWLPKTAAEIAVVVFSSNRVLQCSKEQNDLLHLAWSVQGMWRTTFCLSDYIAVAYILCEQNMLSHTSAFPPTWAVLFLLQDMWNTVQEQAAPINVHVSRRVPATQDLEL